MNFRSFLIFVAIAGLFLVLFNHAKAGNVGVSVTVYTPECNNGVDDDGDTFMDFPNDVGCSTIYDNDETDTVTECNDGIDNDSNGFVDFSDDIGCDSLLDDTELTSGGGSTSEQPAHVTFNGIAYNGGSLTILRNGTIESTASVDESGIFSSSFTFNPGVYTFTLIAFDIQGRSRALSYTVNLLSNSSTEISGINFPYIIDLLIFEEDQTQVSCPTKGDLNSDCKVNLIDFSIAAYWWNKQLSFSFSNIESSMLNADDKVDIYDFSILAYFWTG